MRSSLSFGTARRPVELIAFMLSKKLGICGVGVDEKDFALVGEAEEIPPSECQTENLIKSGIADNRWGTGGWIENDELVGRLRIS